jgi:hypothetical protein
MTKLAPWVLVVGCLLPLNAGAQSLTSSKAGEERAQKARREQPVPKQYLPPAGMCRIWVDNVPAARQPAPTSCATAIRNKPPNARVIFPAGRGRDEKGVTPKGPRPDTTKRKPPA